MTSYSLSHVSDPALLHGLATIVTRDRITTAVLLAHLAEVDERRLYVPAAYPSMFLYCVHALHMSEDVAYKRISVARTPRQYPAIFPMPADGRLNQTAVLLLGPHLTSETANSLLAAATHKTKPEVELLLAERFPRPDVPTLLQLTPAAPPCDELVLQSEPTPERQLALERVGPTLASDQPDHGEILPARAKLAPLSPERFALQVTVDKGTYEQLRYAQALLGHAVPNGDVAQVLKRALDALVEKLEQQKFARCARSRPQRGVAKGRHIPAAVRRAVVERDGGRCTFVSEHGKRCESRTQLELDHVEPLARGGEATVAGIRLLCRAHNQHAADCALGKQFMDGKRQQARERTAANRAQAAASADAQEQARAAAETASQEEVIPWLARAGMQCRDGASSGHAMRGHGRCSTGEARACSGAEPRTAECAASLAWRGRSSVIIRSGSRRRLD
jgi:5-methylcytosine-specific restriction endonuclease McrA